MQGALNPIRCFVVSCLLWLPLASFGAGCDAEEKENFQIFFFNFSGNKDFAISRTAYPLKVLAQQYGIDEMGNDVSSTKRLSRTKQQDSDLPTLSAILQRGNLIAKPHEQSPKSFVVQVFGDNSEWGQTYHFSLKGKCWFLTEFREHTVSSRHWVEQQEFAPRSEQVPHFYIKQDNQPLRAMMRVLNHLSFINESLAIRDMEDAQAELLSLCENVEASVDYAIEDREQVAKQLREALSWLNRGGDVEGITMLGNISRTLWTQVK